MKYSLKKQANKQSLAELFMNLSDSFDEDIPDVIWQNSEFEVKIDQPKINCDIEYISTKKGGEFTIKLSWITPTGKKKLEEEALKKTKAKVQGKGKGKSKGKRSSKSKPVAFVEEEEDLLDEIEFDLTDDADWEDDFDDEW